MQRLPSRPQGQYIDTLTHRVSQREEGDPTTHLYSSTHQLAAVQNAESWSSMTSGDSSTAYLGLPKDCPILFVTDELALQFAR